MEKPRLDHQSPRKLMKTNLLCIPSLKTNNNNNKNLSHNKALTPATLFERFREAVYRLIFLSAVSNSTTSPTSITTSRDVSNYDHTKRCAYYAPDINDHRQSEAVADCIEFIKKKAGPYESDRGSSASSSVDSTSSEGSSVVVPVQQFVL